MLPGYLGLTRVKRASSQNSGAREVDRVFLPLFPLILSLSSPLGVPSPREEESEVWWLLGIIGGHSNDSNIKPTFGMPSVIPGRDFFSL
jgi:hypothetical protein